MTVEPVVVSPDMDSKKASVNDISISDQWNGNAPKVVSATHVAMVRRNAWRMPSGAVDPRDVAQSPMPTKSVKSELAANASQSA